MKTKRILSIILIILVFSIVCADPPDWQAIQGTLYSMLLISHIVFNGELFEGIGNNMAGAFCFTDTLECRSVATWQVPNPPHWEGYWHFVIVANENGEEISFKIYDEETDSIYDCIDTIIFENDTTIGTPYEPFELTAQLGAPENVNIEIVSDGDSVKITWNNDGFTYRVYSSAYPFTAFPDTWSLEGTVNNAGEITLPILTGNKGFYIVTAVAGNSMFTKSTIIPYSHPHLKK